MKFLDVYIILPEFFFINTIVLFLWAGLYLRYIKPTSLWSRTFGSYSVFLLILLLSLFLNTKVFSAFAFNGIYTLTAGFIFFKFLILLVTIPIFIVTIDAEKTYKVYDSILEIWFLRLLVVSSLLLLISVEDLIPMFFLLELYALSSYVLVGYKGRFSVFSSEAAIKYFILGTIFSILFVYGISLLYMSTGLTNLSDIEAFFGFVEFFSNNKFYNFSLLAVLLLLAGILFKVAAAPFHFWSPDVYDGTSTSIVLFLSTVPKIALFALLMKLSFLFQVFEITGFLLVSGLLSVTIGSLGGLFQKRIKRLLAYSMINNTGFLILAISVINVAASSFVVFFLFSYLLTLVGLFGVILSLRVLQSGYLIKNLYGLRNLFFINKNLAVALVFLLFSSAGLPPLVGFLSKFFILLTLADFNTHLFYILIFVLLLAPLSAFYYVRVLKIMSFSKKKFWLFFRSIPASTAYVISLLVFSLVALFWLSGFLLLFSSLFIS